MATMIFTLRLTLAGRATERKIMSAGIDTEASTAKRNTGVISNSNTLHSEYLLAYPACISGNNQHRYKGT